MSRIVNCVVLGEAAEGLEYVPYPGPLGQRIFNEVSKRGWQRWVDHQTMLINEYRLTPIEPKARQFLVTEMEKFLFGKTAEKPEGFSAPPDGVPPV
jgi:Fe-S cluster biosynthesis and repair protein YggX